MDLDELSVPELKHRIVNVETANEGLRQRCAILEWLHEVRVRELEEIRQKIKSAARGPL